MSPLVYRTPVEPSGELPVLSHRAIVWAAVALVVLGVGLAVGLLVAFGDGQHSAQLDAIKTTGTIVLGTGGAAALWLAARRQRTAELSLNQVHAAHAANVADAEARRVTDLYGKAADQLGSAQAPVRLAGLYALERLAQDNPAQRQTIVNLLCAYLRMPYTPARRETEHEPVQPPAARRSGVPRPLLGTTARRRASVRLTPPAPRADTATSTATGAATEAEQERQVRRTAQAILFHHLLFGGTDEPVDTFWSGINLDLTGAVLGPANLIGCRILAADFTGATFTGDAWFSRAQFGLDAVFTGVRFAGEASFSDARFDHDARFDGARFDEYARFEDADFGGRAKFERAEFRAAAVFTGAKFVDEASFHAAPFAGQAEFDKAQFTRGGTFIDARFAENACFNGAEFGEITAFPKVQFAGAFTSFSQAMLGRADFRAAEFGPNTDFTDTRFTGHASFDMTTFTKDVEFIRAKFDEGATFNGTRFTTHAITITVFEDVEFGDNTRFHECHFGQSTNFKHARFTADVLFERTKFAKGVGFVEATFSGRAQFIQTSFDHVCGFPTAHFGGDTIFDHVHFGGPVAFVGADFARTPQIKTVWVRLDGRKLNDVDSTWPPKTNIRETSARPHGIHEGQWGLLVPAPLDEATAQ